MMLEKRTKTTTSHWEGEVFVLPRATTTRVRCVYGALPPRTRYAVTIVIYYLLMAIANRLILSLVRHPNRKLNEQQQCATQQQCTRLTGNVRVRRDCCNCMNHKYSFIRKCDAVSSAVRGIRQPTPCTHTRMSDRTNMNDESCINSTKYTPIID